MKTWKQFVESRRQLAQDYSKLLSGVPQDPDHHPEGDVLTHVRLVRRSIPKAVQELNSLKQNPEIGQILAQMDFSVSPEEEQILAMAAWLHDVGKATATTIDGNPWQNGGQGKIQAIGHESPQHYQPLVSQLGQSAPPQTVEFFKKHEPLLDFLIQNHMNFSSGQGFSRPFVSQHFDNGQVKPTEEMKLLLILMWADKMGRKPEDTIVATVAKNARSLGLSAEKSRQRTANMARQSTGFQGSPEEFAALLKSKGLPYNQRLSSLKNKFPQLGQEEIARLIPEGFRAFLENEAMQPVSIPANIPVPSQVRTLSDALKQGDPNVQIYIVGGAVRDYLFHQFHGDKSTSYKPKDVDLTSNLSEEEILERLRSPYAQKLGIRVKEKESVDTFGVVFASVQGSETFEIAPFRKDIGIADGRRPEKTERGTVHDDAMRRDLTINNLYYDFEKGVILDFNPSGQGIEDVRNKAARMVGNPAERLDEDKLRILRLVRFFSRFNAGSINGSLDNQTKAAVAKFRNLYDHSGITAERIEMEFLAGLKQSLNTAAYIKNYSELGLLESVFPKLNVDVSTVDRLGNLKNPRVVLAWLLRNNQNVSQHLNALKYPNEISEPVQFLIDAMSMGTENAVAMVKHRDRRLIRPGKKKTSLSPEEISANEQMTAEMRQDLQDLSQILGNNMMPEDQPRIQRIQHLRSYVPPQISGEELMKQGLRGEEIGAEQQRRARDHYTQSFSDYSKASQPKFNVIDNVLLPLYYLG